MLVPWLMTVDDMAKTNLLWPAARASLRLPSNLTPQTVVVQQFHSFGRGGIVYCLLGNRVWHPAGYGADAYHQIRRRVHVLLVVSDGV